MLPCPCGSANPYTSCCGLFIETGQKPQTPEQLMRSRYTAYSLANINYIQNTMKGDALVGFKPHEAQIWAKRITWLGLEIIQAEPPTEDIGFVEFSARFLEHNQAKVIHELSEFHKENGCWFYVRGENQQKRPLGNKPPVARNSPCPCGSGRKFKNCHAN